MFFWTALIITMVYYIVLFRIDKKRQAAYRAEQNAIATVPLDLSILEKTDSTVRVVTSPERNPSSEQLDEPIEIEQLEIEPIQETSTEQKSVEPKQVESEFVEPIAKLDKKVEEEKNHSSKQKPIDLTSGIVEGADFLFERFLDSKPKKTMRPKLKR